MAKDTEPQMQDSDTGMDDGAGVAPDNNITLDMTNPDIADAFSSCQPGETLTVESKDDTSIVLAKGAGYEDDETEEEPTPAAPKSGVERLMAKKMGA